MKCLKVLQNGHNKGVQSMDFSRDGRYLLSVGNYQDNFIMIWDLETCKIISKVEKPHIIHSAKWNIFSEIDSPEFITVGKHCIIFWTFEENSNSLMV